MTAIQRKAAILFADISGSTALYDKLGNAQALKLVTHTLDILTQEMAACQGTLIKTIGDEILCTFPDVVSAVEAACAMQLKVDTLRPGGNIPVNIRIGLHYGEIIFEGGDVYGDTVNIAARVTAITRARQIMTTQAVVEILPQELRQKARAVMRTGFRGKEKTFDVFHILWEVENTVSTRIGMSAFRKPAEARHELILRYKQQIVNLSEEMNSVVLGRGEECELLIRTNYASRQHAHIEYNFGKYLITDHSANGTFIRFSDKQVIQLNHQQMVLHGAGEISCGQPFAENPSEIVEYIVQ
jgi:class 3 adenylate cyclase